MQTSLNSLWFQTLGPEHWSTLECEFGSTETWPARVRERSTHFFPSVLQIFIESGRVCPWFALVESFDEHFNHGSGSLLQKTGGGISSACAWNFFADWARCLPFSVETQSHWSQCIVCLPQ